MSAERARGLRRAIVVACVLLIAAGCAGHPPTSTAAAATSPRATDEVSAEQLASWVRFRSVFGLRADVEWVLAVAKDPTAVGAELGVPLLPSELDQVAQANATAQSLVSPARGYGSRFPNEFAGAWIEGPAVILAFTDGLDGHRADAAALFGQKVIVRQAQYPLRDLNGFAATVLADRDWFPTIGAVFRGVNVDERSNRVEVRYRAANQAVEPLIRARFGQPDWIRLTYEGPLPWTGPLGALELTVVDRDGRRVAVDCLLHTLDPRVRQEDGREFPDGKCVFTMLPAVEWMVDVTYDVGGENTTVTRKLVVPADGTIRSTLIVDP